MELETKVLSRELQQVVPEVELLKQLSLHQEHQITLKEALFVIPMN